MPSFHATPLLSFSNGVVEELQICFCKDFKGQEKDRIVLRARSLACKESHVSGFFEDGTESYTLVAATRIRKRGNSALRLMDAVAKGALQAEKPASRFKIGKEADEFSSIPTLGNLALPAESKCGDIRTLNPLIEDAMASYDNPVHQ
ncbi:hypothetical protein RHSIM_Rhsim12G0093100 [Rhododendron simsii]|uniref:Uncharacterized protein n=1 Tax=Rhododendron simsii TaxID=118357 RepID=A0A834L710_RHOSS|nr:hypothetical protein RHSIM_Rhsim12G0093100 [Rhododendron simsii]